MEGFVEEPEMGRAREKLANSPRDTAGRTHIHIFAFGWALIGLTVMAILSLLVFAIYLFRGEFVH